MNKTTGVFLLNIEDETKEAIKIIEKFRDINNLNFQIRIFYDFTKGEEYGYFETDSNKVANLFINPQKCFTEPIESRLRKGYIEDYSVISTILHEFGHFLDFKLNLLENYKQQNFNKIDLGAYAATSKEEEFAELIVIYLLNPYFLKLIDKERYKFLRKLFKNPISCTKVKFLSLYNKWPNSIKEDCKKRYDLIIR